MSDRANIKLPRETYERHNERRQELGMTWAEYLDADTAELEATVRRVVREELQKHEQ